MAYRVGTIIIRFKMTTLTRVGLNAQLLSLQQSYRSAGISWYIFNLLQNLGDVASDFQFTAFVNTADFQSPSERLSVRYSSERIRNPPVRILWEQLRLPLALRREKIDLLHSLAFVSPLATQLPTVVTIYDLSFLHYPHLFKPFNRWYLSTLTRLSAKRADAVIAISESTRQDVISAFNVPSEKVHTVYCGADASFQPLPSTEIEAFRTKHQLPQKFIFRLGTIEPRKNVEGVIKAYAEWRARDKSAPPLVVAGGKGWYYQQVFKLVESLNLQDSVFFPGYVPQADLPLWYNAASLMVYPSHFEGFGLPVLESMACGTPVVTANVSSLPEVAGTAALMVSPTDTTALSRAMQSAFEDETLAQSMREKGLRQAAKFSWAKAAQQTTEIYTQVLGLI